MLASLRVIGTETLQLAALKKEIISGALLTAPYNFLAQLVEDARRFAKIEREVKKEEVFDFSVAEKAADEIKKGEIR